MKAWVCRGLPVTRSLIVAGNLMEQMWRSRKELSGYHPVLLVLT